jgi:hypothetical protein
MAFQSAKRELRKQMRETLGRLSATSITQQCLFSALCVIFITDPSQPVS